VRYNFTTAIRVIDKHRRRPSSLSATVCKEDVSMAPDITSQRLTKYQGFWRFLSRPNDIQYVLFPIEGDRNASIYGDPSSPSIPPKIEVDEKRYHYYPCPLDSADSTITSQHQYATRLSREPCVPAHTSSTGIHLLNASLSAMM
jgi:hypothetical protein